MAELFKPLHLWSPTDYQSASIRGQGAMYMVPPSKNALLDGSGFIRVSRGPALLNGLLGSQLFFLADTEYCGLGDGSAPVSGSILSARQLLIFVGSGQVNFAGAEITGAVATSTPSYIKKVANAYIAANLYQIGHAQPSAPQITAKDIPSVNQTAMNAAVSVVIWRISEADNQPSLMSLPSNVLILSGQSVILPFPSADSNGQTDWGIGVPKPGLADLGVFYQLPTSLNGIVSESALSATLDLGSCSIADGTSVVDTTNVVTSEQLGWRISFSTFDSYITAINSPTQVEVADENTSGGTITGDGTATYAVDGILRAIEISWTAGALLGQDIAPDKAFPPPASQFMGAMNDVFFVESDGIIYVSEPGFLGSYPPSNALFPNEPGVRYLRITDGLIARWGKTSFGVLTYVGGSPALEWHELWHNQGILYPQNVGIGARGRILVWLGKPAVIENGIQPDDDYGLNVLPDFDGWDTEQTEETPIVPGYDPVGKFECWFLKKKANVIHVPSGWCSPQDFTDQIVGDIVDAVTYRQKLYFATSDGVDVRLYQFDAGTGSTAIIQFDDTVETLGDKITEVYVRGRVDNVNNPVRVEIVKNFADNNDADDEPILISDETPAEAGYYALRTRKRQVFNAKTHTIRVTMTSEGGDAGIDIAGTRGSSSDTILARQT